MNHWDHELDEETVYLSYKSSKKYGYFLINV